LKAAFLRHLSAAADRRELSPSKRSRNPVGNKTVFLLKFFKRSSCIRAENSVRNGFENGVLTGKGLSYGGSKIRPEATGFGAAYFLEEILRHQNDDIKGKTFCISGYGNAAWGAVKKVSELGGKVVTVSGSEGYIYDENGICGEKVDFMEHMLTLRAQGKSALGAYTDKFGGTLYKGEKPWGKVKADVYMPCAMQNEINLEDAKGAVALGVKYLCEVSNMPTSNEALDYLYENGVVIAPSKAANAGGVAVSGLEMSQNSQRLGWTSEQVDAMLKDIMKSIHSNIVETLGYYRLPYNLIQGANLAGFKKVADAMLAQGIY